MRHFGGKFITRKPVMSVTEGFSTYVHDIEADRVRDS